MSRKQPTPKPLHGRIEVVLIIADEPTLNGNVYTIESLRALADSHPNLRYDYATRALLGSGALEDYIKDEN